MAVTDEMIRALMLQYASEGSDLYDQLQVYVGEATQFLEWMTGHTEAVETVFDVGAHIGLWSRFMALYYPDAHYHMFEPSASFDEEIRQGLAFNASSMNGTAVAKAVGRRPATAKFWSHGWRGVSSSLLFNEKADDLDLKEVEVIALDDYASEQGIESVDFLKMDVQGGELDALKGATNLLKSTKFLFLETWLVSSYSGKTPHIFEVFDFLRGFGIFPIDLLGGTKNQHGVTAHVDVLYLNVNNSPFPGHLYQPIANRLTS